MTPRRPESGHGSPRVGYSTDHPHGPPDPEWIAPNGSCALCARSVAEKAEARAEALCDRLEAADEALRYIEGLSDRMTQEWEEQPDKGFEGVQIWITQRTKAIRRTARAALSPVSHGPQTEENND